MRDADWFSTLFGTLSFMTAGWSAHLWFKASRIALPSATGDDWDGRGPFENALKSQSDMNARAAFAAAVAALLQALSMGAKVLRPYLGLN